MQRRARRLRTRSEQELAGYRDAQDYLFQHDWRPLSIGLLLFGARAAAGRSSGSKQDRVRDYVINHAPDEFRMADIRAALPGVSDPTIRLVLDRLRADQAIASEGVGRGALWRRLRSSRT